MADAAAAAASDAAAAAAAASVAAPTPVEEAAAAPAAKRRRHRGRPAAPKEGVLPTAGDASALHITCRPETYAHELDAKVAAVRASFGAAGVALPGAVDVYPSAPSHFRLKATFGVEPRSWRGTRSYLAMYPTKNRPVEVTDFPMGSARINQLMGALMERVMAQPDVLRDGLFEAKFHTTLAGDALVTLAYHRPLDATWRHAAETLRTDLGLVGLVGRARGQREVVGQAHVTERLAVCGRTLTYKQLEDSFSQSNGGIAQCMLSWAVRAACDAGDDVDGYPPARQDDLLELYCGSGAFTVALAPCFRAVLATEVSKPATECCRHNLAANGCANVDLGRLSAEELQAALEQRRTFERLQHVDVASLQLGTVLVDPPRAGCGPSVSRFLTRFDRIIYISCNPATMVQDIQLMLPTHTVTRFACFDQFAYTPHVESGALLVRRTSE